MNRLLRNTTRPTTILLVCAIAVSSCANKASDVAEKEATQPTGPHGGVLVTLEPEAVHSAGIVDRTDVQTPTTPGVKHTAWHVTPAPTRRSRTRSVWRSWTTIG